MQRKFNNLLYAINRGLLARAVSDAAANQVNWSATLPATARAFEAADVVVQLPDEILDIGHRRAAPATAVQRVARNQDLVVMRWPSALHPEDQRGARFVAET